MTWFIIAIVLLVIAALLIPFAGLLSKLAEYEDDRAGIALIIRIVGAVAIVLSIFIIGLGMTFQVESQTQGVVSSFGAVHEDTAKPGLHTKKPWDKVTQISTAIEGKRYHGDSAIKVTLKGGAEAYVSASTRSGVAPEKANKVFEQFRNYDDPTVEFRKQVVGDQLKAAMYRAFREVDPLSLSGLSEVPLDLKAIESQIRADLIKNGNGMINEDELLVSISGVTPSKKAQRYIEETSNQINKTSQATEAYNTAIKEAAANEKLAKSLTPEILTNKCLEMIKDGVENLPAGFNCTGGGTGVVIPGVN
jgi:hypothetical protein